MPSKQEVLALLKRLDREKAMSLEGQNLEFKQAAESFNDSMKIIINAVICQANGGGGTVVVGVSNDAVGRSKAIKGVPENWNVNDLRTRIYDSTEPTINIKIEELEVPEGTGRLLIIQVPKGRPPFFDTSGKGTIRIGDKCKALTSAIVAGMLAESGEADFSSELLEGRPLSFVSNAAIERLRALGRSLNAPADVLAKNDEDLLRDIGLTKAGRLTRAGLLLLGKDEQIAKHFPGYAWTYFRMTSDTDYDDRADGTECIVLAMDRVLDVISNPIQTVKQKLVHDEFRTFPEIALREALMNAFGHADYRLGSPFQIKQFRAHLEITNAGGMIGGVNPDNILQHPTVTRNPTLMAALIPVRLVNRAKVGVRRMFKAMLAEGKEPPEMYDEGDAVRVIFHAGELSEAFCKFIEESAASNPDLFTVEQLLIIRNVSEHGEIDEQTAAHITQQRESKAIQTLHSLERLDVLERRGRTKIRWRLTPSAEFSISGGTSGASKTEAAVNRVRAELARRRKAKENGLTLAEMRTLTGMGDNQIKSVTRRLREENIAKPTGSGRYARWVLT